MPLWRRPGPFSILEGRNPRPGSRGGQKEARDNDYDKSGTKLRGYGNNEGKASVRIEQAEHREDGMAVKAQFTSKIVDHRRALVLLVFSVSFAIVPLVLHLELDRTLKSAFITSSPAYVLYKKFLSIFGDDEFILVGIKDGRKPGNPEFLKSIANMTTEIEAIPETEQVLSITNIKVFQKRRGIFGSYHLLVKRDGDLRLPSHQYLERIRNGLPILDFLISPDMKTLGIMIRLQDKWKFDPHMGKIQERISRTVKEYLPKGAEFRMTGAAVIRQHVQNITVWTAVVYGILCTVVTALCSLYIFKNLKVAFIQTIVIGVAVEWSLGLMTAFGIPLNSTTSLVFGLILVISVSTVIHIVTHYYEASGTANDRLIAAKKALEQVGGPCLMCAGTTSLAFATVMISTIPMVQQLGFVMAAGVLVAFLISIILTPAFLIAMKPVDQRTQKQIKSDLIHWLFVGMESFVFKHYKLVTVAGIAFVIAMFAGAPLIRIDTQLLGLFTQSNPAIRDLKFLEKNLAPVRSLELVIQAEDGTFKKPEVMRELAQLQGRLERMPEIASVDSPVRLLRYVHGLLAGLASNPDELFSDPRMLSQAYMVVKFSAAGRKLLERYFEAHFSQVHLSIRIKGSATTPIGKLISAVESTGNEAVKGWARFMVTGEQAVFAAQATEVVHSQLLSVLLAFVGVTVLLMIQLRSVALGLISLIPNIPPVAVIFGMMGWLQIPLDNVTVFAAAIAIGLAVDDTIHYLTQVKREIRDAAPGRTVEDCLRQSYQTTARAMMSTSIVLFLGFLMLAFTPTKPAIYFGFLGAGAVLIALLGDLLMAPSIILTFKSIRNMLEKKVNMEKELMPLGGFNSG
jgi:predicted RND superfamily exporter protein